MTTAPVRILAVDDDASLREVLGAFLEDAGFVVTLASTLEAAIACLQRHTFDLVLTDGFSTLPREVLATTAPLRQAAGTTPVVLFTAHTLDDATVHAAGFAALVTKPVDFDELERRLHALLHPRIPA